MPVTERERTGKAEPPGLFLLTGCDAICTGSQVSENRDEDRDGGRVSADRCPNEVAESEAI
jgi:hypothetical protein